MSGAVWQQPGILLELHVALYSTDLLCCFQVPEGPDVPSDAEACQAESDAETSSVASTEFDLESLVRRTASCQFSSVFTRAGTCVRPAMIH